MRELDELINLTEQRQRQITRLRQVHCDIHVFLMPGETRAIPFFQRAIPTGRL